jgi:hypothetical protein
VAVPKEDAKTREWVGPPQNPPTFFSCPIAQLPVDDSVDPFNRHEQEELLKAVNPAKQHQCMRRSRLLFENKLAK